MFKNILLATDGSALSATAIKNGVELAKALGAKITAVHVSEPFHWFDPNMVPGAEAAYAEGTRQFAAKALAAVAEAAKAGGVACETVSLEGQSPYVAIVETAKARGCDLIAMASHGRRGAAAVMIGSETVKVLTHSKIPVLVYR